MTCTTAWAHWWALGVTDEHDHHQDDGAREGAARGRAQASTRLRHSRWVAQPAQRPDGARMQCTGSRVVHCRRPAASAGAACDCPAAVRAYLGLQLGGERCERFAVLYLDSQIRAIAYECHFTGTLTQTSVHPREIVEAALNHRAAAVILAHNHPSGVTQPSRADEVLTRALKEALALVDVRVLDHVIVAGAQSLSMAEEGLL